MLVVRHLKKRVGYYMKNVLYSDERGDEFGNVVRLCISGLGCIYVLLFRFSAFETKFALYFM